jgi:hypothetical protein
MARLIYTLRIRPEPRVDAIRSLRAWLKRGLRDFGLRCLSVCEEPQTQETNMPLDLSNEPSQESPLPAGVYRLRAKLMTGTAGTDFLLKRAKNGVSLMLALECTVVGGEYSGRKVWDYISCELDLSDVITPLPQEKLEKLQTSVRLGRIKLRAIIDSACELDPNDKSEAAQAKRRSFDAYTAFDGIVFYAQLEERPAANGYRAGNNVDFIITCDLPGYPRGTSTALTTPPPKNLRDEMDDEVPFALAFFIISAVTWLVAGGSTLIA